MGEGIKTRRVKIEPYVPVFDNIPADTNFTFIANSINTTQRIFDIAIDNDFLYTVGDGNVSSTFLSRDVRKWHKGNLGFVGNTPVFNSGSTFGNLYTVSIDDDFIYTGGPFFSSGSQYVMRKYNKGNLTSVANTNNYGGEICSSTVDNDYLYVGGGNTTFSPIKRWHKGNLSFFDSSNNFGQPIQDIIAENDFVYAGAFGGIQKFHTSNLVFVGNTPFYSGAICSISTDNDFVYAGGTNSSAVFKYHKGNLALVGNSALIHSTTKIRIDNSFVYASRDGNAQTSRYHKGNLILVSSAVIITNTSRFGSVIGLALDDEFIYTGTSQGRVINKFDIGSEGQTRIVFNNKNYLKE